MIRPNFLSSEERCDLEACVRRQREDHGIARRANALLLLDDGKTCVQIAEFLYLKLLISLICLFILIFLERTYFYDTRLDTRQLLQ